MNIFSLLAYMVDIQVWQSVGMVRRSLKTDDNHSFYPETTWLTHTRLRNLISKDRSVVSVRKSMTYPSNNEVSRGATSSKSDCWSVSGLYTLSNSNSFLCIWPPTGLVGLTMSFSSSRRATTLSEGVPSLPRDSSSPGESSRLINGRSLQWTLMFPRISWKDAQKIEVRARRLQLNKRDAIVES